MADNLNGKIQVQGELVPDGGSTKQPLADVKYVTGAPQTFQSIAELIAFHPNLMKRGMQAQVVESATEDDVLKITTFILMAEPSIMFNPQTLAILVTEDNYLDYWTASNEQFSNFNRVQEYAPDDTNGARPPYPYEDTPAFEANWTPVFDASKGHKWLRFRDDDVDANMDDVFDNWTVPIALGASILGGDFISNRFTRVVVNATLASNQGELVVINLIANDTGHFQVLTGDIDVDDNGDITNLTVGRYFKYDAGFTYTFNNGATAIQTLIPPTTTINSASNDNGLYTVASGLDSILYTDDIPVGTDQLWEIVGQKSVYGSLKSDWVLRKVSEDPSLTRYSSGFTGLPDTVCGLNDNAADEPFNTDLNNLGWSESFILGAAYLATREENGAPPWTAWQIQKVAGESGEFKDRVFKLFPINTDFDQEPAPVGADAIAEGWSDTPLQETAEEINGVSEATKFFDQTLKTPWSTPVAYTGQDSFNDLIVSDFGAAFKYEPNSATPTVPVPTEMTLEAQLFSGILALWPDSLITYAWTRIYDDGAIDNVVADGDTGKTFYFLGTSGTAGQPDYKRFAQRLVVTNQAVNGKAVFECVQTLTLPDASTLVFTDEFVITDVTDGKDAKSLDVSADNQLVLYDVGGAAWSPTEVRLSAFQNNLPTGFTLFWYEETAPNVWTKLVSGVGGYTFVAKPYGGQMVIDVTTVYTADGDLEEKRYAVSNIDGDPTTADNIATFVDFIQVTKTDSSATAVDGEQAVFGILDNEAHVIILDDVTIIPVGGEIGASGKAVTLISVYDGSTRIVQGAGAGKYTVALATSNGGITPNQQVSGNDVLVYINSWTSGERSTNITATISYETGDARGTIEIDKIFSLNSTLDAAGGINVLISSADGRFEFTAADLTDIDLAAELYNDKLTPTLQDPASFWYSWKVGVGAWETVKKGGGGTLGELRTVTRAEIRFNALVEVRVLTNASPIIPDDIIRTNSIAINDVQDGQTYHLYATDVKPFSEPAAPPATIDPAVGNSTWKPSLSPDPTIWAVDGTKTAYATWGNPAVPEYVWSDVYQVGAEAGDQGGQGGGYYRMYSTYDNGVVKPTFPNGNTGTIEQNFAGVGQSKWLGFLPNVDKIWVIERLYQGFTGTSDGVKINGSGLLKGLDDSVVPAVTNSVWSEPILLSGTDGTDGLNGNNGSDGTNGTNGLPPAHQWSSTSLRFQNPNATWGSYVDLKGDKGDKGDTGAAGQTSLGAQLHNRTTVGDTTVTVANPSNVMRLAMVTYKGTIRTTTSNDRTHNVTLNMGLADIAVKTTPYTIFATRQLLTSANDTTFWFTIQEYQQVPVGQKIAAKGTWGLVDAVLQAITVDILLL